MSLSALNKRLKAIEARPTAAKPLRIVGGLPSGFAMIESLAKKPPPVCPELARADAEPAPASRESTNV
jgi:hypothetical protein